MSWQGVKRMLKSYSVIPKEQQELLYSQDSCFPASKGKKFPPANIPPDALRNISLRADHAQAEAEKQDSNSSTSILPTESANEHRHDIPVIISPSVPLTGTQVSDPDAPVGSWSQSPERQPRSKQLLPPDSSLPQPSPSRRLVSRSDVLPLSSDDDGDGSFEDETPDRTSSNATGSQHSRSQSVLDKRNPTSTESDDNNDDTDSSLDEMDTELPSALDDSSIEPIVAEATQRPPNIAKSPLKPKGRTPSPDLLRSVVDGSPIPHHTRPGQGNHNPLALPSSNVHRTQRDVELASSGTDLGQDPVTQVTCPFTSSKSDPVVPSTWQPPANQQADPRLTRSFGNGQNATSLATSPFNQLQPPKAAVSSNSTGASIGSSAVQSYRQSSPIHLLESPIMLMQNTQTHKRAAPPTAVSPGRDRKHRKQSSTATESQDPAFDIKAMKTNFLAKLCEERGVFELFCEAYPSHRVPEDKFKDICRSKLLPIIEILPEASFDDFIIKYSTAYESYLLESLLKNRTPIGYAEFYKANSGQSVNNQFVVNRKTLQLYLGKEGTDQQLAPATNHESVAEDVNKNHGKDDNVESPQAASVTPVDPTPPAAPKPHMSRISGRRTALTDFLAKFAGLKSNKPPETGLSHSWDI